MKATFSILDGFTSVLNRAFSRSTTKFFSSVNLALSSSSSSEDETLLPNCFDGLAKSSNCLSAEQIKRCVGRMHDTPEYKISNFVETDNEMVVMKSMLARWGWNFGNCNFHGVDLDEESVTRVLSDLYNETGSAALPLCFFRWSESSLGLKRTVRSTCTLIHILVLGNMNYRAVDLLEFVVRWHLQPEELLNILHEICTRKVLETVYSMLVYCYTNENMINEALQAVCLIQEVGIFPSAQACDSLLKSLLDSDRAELAWDLLEEMWGRGLVSTTTFSLVIYYYCSKGNLKCGWKLLCDMTTYGIKPDVVAYTTFIHFLCKLSYIREATCFIFKMVEMGIFPDTVSLTSVVHGYCKVGRPVDVVCLIKLFDVQPDVFLYNSFIGQLCKYGDMQKASVVFCEMSNCGILPDCFIYTTMISGYCKAENMRKGLQYLGRMIKDSIEPSIATYTVLIDSHCRSGDMEIAWLLLLKLTRRGLRPDIVLYNTLIKGYGDKGQMQKAYELLGIMKSAGVSPNVVTYNTIIHGLVMSGFVSEAKDMLDELMHRGFSPDVVTFTNVIGGYSNKGQFAEAFVVWSCMNDFNVAPDVVTCGALIKGYCRAHQMDEAHVLFHEMLDAGLTPDLILYNTLIQGFCRLGNIEEACQLINMMVECNIVPNDATYRALIHGYEKKHVNNPVESAVCKVQQILQRHGIIVH